MNMCACIGYTQRANLLKLNETRQERIREGKATIMFRMIMIMMMISQINRYYGAKIKGSHLVAMGPL